MSDQPTLFDLPDLPIPGWHPSRLDTGAQVHWARPAELEARLDATYYVITRRPERLLDTLACPTTPITEWAAVNPAKCRLPVERGYILYEWCLYAEIRDVRDGCWALGPALAATTVPKLPVRARYEVKSGDLLLPRVYSSLHKAVLVLETELQLIASSAFALLRPHSREHGLALLALLHHRVLGEQLWALASGTTVRAVSASKVDTLQVPRLEPALRSALATRVEELLHAQTMFNFPNVRMPVSLYWQDGTLFYWQRQAHTLAKDIERYINQVLETNEQ